MSNTQLENLKLPRPDRSTGMFFPKLSGLGSGNIAITSKGIKLNIRTSRTANPEEARQLALMLLSAADILEAQQEEQPAP